MKRLLLILASIAFAQQELLAESNTQYVRLTKAMVINYGEPSLSRLKYLKVAVDVRVPSASAADLVEYHRPMLLDALVTVFTDLEAEVVKSADGKEEIRQQALAELQRAMKSEEGDQVIEDLLFSSFVVQR